MSVSEDVEVRDAFKRWAEQMDCLQYQIFVGLQATVKSVSKVLSKYIE
jgi:hypothetical protein